MMRRPHSPWLLNGIFALIIALGFTTNVFAQFDRIAKAQAKDMLKAARSAIKDDYFDAKFKGVDIDAKSKAAEEKIDGASSMGQALGIIAQFVLELNDSHTLFYPPARSLKVDYGWRMQMIGDKCLVTAVKPGSGAEKLGLKPGDEIVQVEGFKPSRKDLWKINYYYNTISLRNGLNVKVISPGSTEVKEMNLPAQTKKQLPRLSLEDLIREIDLDTGRSVTHRFNRVGGTIIWKMPSFVIDPDQIDQIMRNRIKGSANLILDLRNNGGGYVVALERLAGYFVEKDTEIAKLVARKPMKPQMAKAQSEGYKGKLIILIDSNSGSASEIFARFMQLQQRGVVMGEQSAGAVMQSRTVPMQMGADSIVPFGMSVTNADVILSDGVSLEHIGVTPHIAVAPTAAQVAAGHDPVVAAALKLLDQEMSAEAAGKLFPLVWEEN